MWRAGGHEQGAVARSHGDGSVGTHRQSPSFGVESVVMMSTEREQIRQVGVSAVFPPVDVVRFGDGDMPPASGDGARSVHGSERSSLADAGVSSTAAVVEADRPYE
jgi:hypothetical protein